MVRLEQQNTPDGVVSRSRWDREDGMVRLAMIQEEDQHEVLVLIDMDLLMMLVGHQAV